MKYIFFSLVFLFTSLKAQSILSAASPEGLKSKDSIQLSKIIDGTILGSDRPIKYIDVDEKDIIWSKLVWEIIDLEEESNKAFKVNIKSTVNSRSSLYKALLKGMELSTINEVYEDDNFTKKLDQAKLLERNKVRVLSEDGKKFQNANPGKLVPDSFYDEYEIDNDQVTRFKIFGMWYIDKRIGELKYRLLGISPMGPDINVLAETGEKDYVDLFWVWYADARTSLHQFKVFNGANSNSKISFDDLLTARRFSALIYKIENKDDDTLARVYPEDAESQVEAALKFREELVSREADMWAY